MIIGNNSHSQIFQLILVKNVKLRPRARKITSIVMSLYKNSRRIREKKITVRGISRNKSQADSNKFQMLNRRRRCFISATYAKPVWNRTPRSPLIKYRNLHNLFRSSHKSSLARAVYLECWFSEISITADRLRVRSFFLPLLRVRTERKRNFASRWCTNRHHCHRRGIGQKQIAKLLAYD